MRILITGATGLLGKTLCPMLDNEGWQYWGCNSKIFDVTDTKMVNEIMNKISLDFIIHLAGYTNIDLAETHPKEAYSVNQDGTKNIARIAKKHNIPILYVSTDNVFDGTSKVPYKTTDATNPINVYGKSKLAGEMEIMKATKKYYILRTSWLYGAGGYVDGMLTFSNFRKSISIVNDQIGTPTSCIELSKQIIEIIKDKKPYGIYHVASSGSTNWADFTKKIFEIKKRNVAVEAIDKGDFPRPAKRPKYCVLDSSINLPDWQSSLEEYLCSKK
ncbi:dTDP-4-dehydrorhamnose reductase [bacterium]|nr:dTDP-4-dehydrorhamnose reductase [bacterium]